MELARGLAVIANGGYDVEPYLIQSITDVNGEAIYEAPEVILCDRNCGTKDTASTSRDEETENAPALTEETAPKTRVMRRLADERSVTILHSMLRDVVKRGTGRGALALGRDDIAGKTGTTNEQRDTWFAGFNHNLATTVWVGFDQPQPLGRREYGASTALPIWIDYMKVALDEAPASFMPRPNGIVNIRINPETGKRARPGEDGTFEIFKEEDACQRPSRRIDGRPGGTGGNGDDLSRQIF